MREILYISAIILVSSITVPSCNNNGDGPDAYGNFEANPVIVSSESQGKLLRFKIEEGLYFSADVPVGLTDTTTFHLQKQQIIASMQTLKTKMHTLLSQVEAQEVQLKNVRREYNRIQSLVKDGAATLQKRDEIEGNVRFLASQINAMKTQKATLLAESDALDIQLALVNDQIERSIINNPISGIVLQKYKEEGEIVMPGQSLYKIADLDTLILRAYISGRQLSDIKIGQDVRVYYDKGDTLKELTGKVIWISSEAEFTPKIIQTREERVNLVYAIKIEVSNDQGELKIGMPGELKL
ncbi:MAG: HlyD family efflux transporter periplasmic adaptor subunit [Bacteroidales bacterium]|nr:HlyD family efflux transporter periplasmic adaptor subunit [Bacteroidales bacterium]